MGSCTSVLCTVHLAASRIPGCRAGAWGKRRTLSALVHCCVIVRNPLNRGSVHAGPEYPAIALSFSITLALGTVNLNSNLLPPSPGKVAPLYVAAPSTWEIPFIGLSLSPLTAPLLEEKRAVSPLHVGSSLREVYSLQCELLPLWATLFHVGWSIHADSSLPCGLLSCLRS